MADNTKWFETAMAWVGGAAKSVGQEVGSEMVAEYFFGGRGKGTPLREQFTKLWGEGKREEAKKLLEASPSGWGWADEEILEDDICAIMEVDILDQRYWHIMPEFLNTLEDYQKENFRHSHTMQGDVHARRRKLIKMAMLPDHAARKAILDAVQITKPSLNQTLQKKFWEYDAELGVKVQQSQDRVAARRRKMNRPWWKRLFR